MSLTCTTYHRSSVSVKGLFVFLVLLCFLLAAKQSKAQNLFVNAGFEDQNVCTDFEHGPGTGLCAPRLISRAYTEVAGWMSPI